MAKTYRLSIEACIGMLTNEQTAVRQAAAMDLGEIANKGDQVVIEALLGSLEDQSVDVRLKVVKALGQVAEEGHKDVVQALGAMLQRDENQVMRKAVIPVFEKVATKGDEFAIDTLKAVLQADGSTEVQKVGLAALQRLAGAAFGSSSGSSGSSFQPPSRQTSKEAVGELAPTRIKRGQSIGAGTTADVFLGLLDGNIRVAIKELNFNKKELAERRRKAFDREVAILTTLRHDNLVACHGVVSESRPFMIIMELCEGGCVFDFLHSTPLSFKIQWSQKHKMCLDVARGTEYLHNCNPQIIHRDLKSLNLLLQKAVASASDKPVVKVSDFGLSRMQEQTLEGPPAPWAKMTKAAGTCHWMAPEATFSTRYNEKVDVYSYAMCMYETICQEIPFEEEEAEAVKALVVAGERPDLEAVPADCPPVMKSLMVRCWNQDPRSRPGFTSVVKELEELKPALWPPSW